MLLDSFDLAGSSLIEGAFGFRPFFTRAGGVSHLNTKGGEIPPYPEGFTGTSTTSSTFPVKIEKEGNQPTDEYRIH